MNGPGPPLLLEYWQILLRHKGVLCLVACLGLLAALLLTLPQTPVYQARTTLEIQNLNENFLNMRAVNPTSNEPTAQAADLDLQTQLSILQSESVIKHIISDPDLDAKLTSPNEMGRLASWRNSLGLPAPKRALSSEDVLHQVAKHLKVHIIPNTRLIEILYDSTDPRLAAKVANALTATYIQQNLESHWQTAQQTGEWLTHQMEEERVKLERSEHELQAYASAQGLLFTAETDNVAEAKLRQIQEELSKAHADRVAWQSRYERTASASPDSLPEVLNDPTLKEYQGRLTDLRRQLAELSASLTPLHPSVKKIQAAVKTLEAARDTERANVTRSIQNQFESARQREHLLAGSYDTQAGLVTEQAGKATHYNILKRGVDKNRQIYDSMLQLVREAGIASALHASNVRVVDPAAEPLRPYKPVLTVNAMLGLLAGGFFGIVYIVLKERADRSIQFPGEAAIYLDVPELGVIPSAAAERRSVLASYGRYRDAAARKRQKDSLKTPVELATWNRPSSVLADSFRSTLTSILYSAEAGDQPCVIAFTSASPQEGKTTVASNLALALVEIGKRVLLIDGDLCKPRLHELFRVSNDWGLSDFLTGAKPPEGSNAMVIATEYRGLHVLPAGSVVLGSSRMLHSPRISELLQQVRKEFDMVLIDTPPALPMPDARVLGRLVDGVVLVVRASRTNKDTIASVSQRLLEDGTRVLGAVLNEWDPRRRSHSVYEYGVRRITALQEGPDSAVRHQGPDASRT